MRTGALETFVSVKLRPASGQIKEGKAFTNNERATSVCAEMLKDYADGAS
jgi:hypothetical protein